MLSFRETKDLIAGLEKRADNDVELNTKRDEFVKKRNLVLSADDNARVFPYASDHVDSDGGQFVDPDAYCSLAGKCWGPAMGKHKPDPVLAKAPSGKPFIVYPKTAALEAINKNAPRGQKISTRSSRPPSEVARERSHRARVKEFNSLLEKVAERGNESWTRSLAIHLRSGHAFRSARVCAASGQAARDRRERASQARRRSARAPGEKPAKEVRGAVVELLFCRFAPSSYSKGWDKQFEPACDLFEWSRRPGSRRLEHERRHAMPLPEAAETQSPDRGANDVALAPCFVKEGLRGRDLETKRLAGVALSAHASKRAGDPFSGHSLSPRMSGRQMRRARFTERGIGELRKIREFVGRGERQPELL